MSKKQLAKASAQGNSQTGSQKALHLVSQIMLIVSAFVLAMGVVVLCTGSISDVLGIVLERNLAPASGANAAAVYRTGWLLVAIGALDVAVCLLGVRASRDSSRVGAYQNVIAIVTVALMVVLVNGLTSGVFTLSNFPLLVIVNLAFSLVCFGLANRVNKDYLDGVFGSDEPAGDLSGAQRVLRVLCVLLCMLAVFEGAFGALAAGTLSGGVDQGDAMALGLTGLDVGMSLGRLAVLTVADWLALAAVDMAFGLVGWHAASHGGSFVPFAVLGFVACGLYAFNLVVEVMWGRADMIVGNALSLLVVLICLMLARAVSGRQRRMSRKMRDLVDVPD